MQKVRKRSSFKEKFGFHSRFFSLACTQTQAKESDKQMHFNKARKESVTPFQLNRVITFKGVVSSNTTWVF